MEETKKKLVTFGYDVVNQKCYIKEHEANTVRFIYEMYNDGLDCDTIIKKLEENQND